MLQHTNSRYEQDLASLSEALKHMGDLVCEQIGDAVRCLFAGDAKGADVSSCARCRGQPAG